MSPSEITRRLTEVFRDVLDDEAIALSRDTTAEDIEAWDSLAHISLIVAIEKEFGISIDLAELEQLKNVGEIVIDLIERKGS